MNKRHTVLSKVMFLLMSISLVAVAVGYGTTAPAKKNFKLGVMGPFTGPSSNTGEQFQNAVKMAFEKIDYKIADYAVELVWIDSQSDPEKAIRAYEKAVVKNGIHAGLLNWHSSVAVAAMEVAAKYKIMHFFTMGATDIVNGKFNSNPSKYSYWNFKIWPVPPRLTVNYVTAIEDAIAAGIWDPGKKQAVIYGEDTDWGRGFGSSLKKQLKKGEWTILDEYYFPLDQTDFESFINKIKDKDIQLLAGTNTASISLSTFLKQADKAGIKAHIIADGMGWIGEWHKLTGSSSNYVLDQMASWTTDEAKSFAKVFQDRWELTPTPSIAGLAYDATNFFIKIAQATYKQYGKLSSETLHCFSEKNVVTGKFTYTDGIIMSEYKYTPETVPDPVIGENYYAFSVLQYMDGEGYVVWPKKWKTKDIKMRP